LIGWNESRIMSKILKTPSGEIVNQAIIEQEDTGEELNSYNITDSETGLSLSIQANSETEALKIFKEKLATIKKP
jgi:hypothetical protein